MDQLPAGAASLWRMPAWIPVAFCASGFAALVYQVVWQRVLFAAFGVNVEAVTVVVTAFLAGLGCGSMVGGWLAQGSDPALLRRFSILEIATGLFGLASLGFFRWIGETTLALPSVQRGLLTAAIVMLPTTLMGATLPILVSYLVRLTGNVGRSVAALYFINTAGSALAAFMTVVILLKSLGEAKSVMLAAALNLAIGAFVLVRSFGRHTPA
jgi:spermidine synthase